MRLLQYAIGILAACCLVMLGISLDHPYAIGQEPALTASNKEATETKADKPFKIRVAVEEVRLDAVVLDKKGRPISDLTADDFEVSQDYLPQKVLSSVYITNQAESTAQPSIPRKDKKTVVPLPTPTLAKEKVHRTIVFVLDDISMSFENLHHAKLCLKNFVEKQMQTGDLVAILRTSYGNSALQMFLSDKRQLLARIETVRWGANAGYGVDPNNQYIVYDNQLTALGYSVRALQNMPGRKIILHVTAQPTISKRIYRTVDEMFKGDDIDYYYMYSKAFNRLANEALRAGVVVHSLDIRGLEAPGENNDYSRFDNRASDGLNPLPVKTGGIIVENSNFFVDGIGEVDNMIKGYYLISYEPPATTFKTNRKEIFHRIRIKVKRKGAEVHTRDGFYGVTEAEEEPELAKNPLREAIFSPFQHRDLKVSLASGFIDDSKAGYLLRSWLHVDADDLSILDKKEEGSFIDLETVCLTMDINGRIQDSRIVKYLFRVKPENIAWIKEHGIRFSILLPVKKPGSYYVRTAVRDMQSGKVGSAYQFVEIPDLQKKKALALSNIFMINRDEDIAWLRSTSSKEITEGTFSPVLQKEDNRSPALRSYKAGDNFKYMAVIYNAESEKGSRPELELQSVLYKDGSELFRSAPKPVDLNGSSSFARIPILQKLTLGTDLKEGDYVLQLIATDKQKSKKNSLASQTLSFEIQVK
jgi:VWFA-related protein